MKLADYNSFPEHMEEMTEESWQDFFTYCIKDIESRQAYKNSIYELHTDLRIFWIKKEAGLGMCISREPGPKHQIKFYRLGTQQDWEKFKNGVAAMMAGDNS